MATMRTDEKRDRRVELYLNDTEFAQANEAASNEGRTLSDHILRKSGIRGKRQSTRKAGEG